MEDTQSTELASEVTQETGLDNSESTQQENGLVDQAETQTNPEEQTQEVELSALEQDKRFKEHWGEDLNKVHEHIKHIESKQSESQQIMKENETLRQEMQDYNRLKEIYNSSPETRAIYDQSLNSAEEQVLKARYGDLPIQTLRNLQSMEHENQQLREKQAQFEMHQIANEQLTRVQEAAKSAGIDAKIDEFINYAQENRIPHESYEKEWHWFAKDSLTDAAVKRAIEANNNAKKETAKASVFSGNGAKVPTKGKVDIGTAGLWDYVSGKI